MPRRVGRTTLLTTLVLATAAASCSSKAEGPFLATAKQPANGYMASLIRAKVVDRRGCIVAEASDGTMFLPIWPSGSKLSGAGQTPLTVLDPQGAAIARVGETTGLGGGWARRPSDLRPAAALVGQEVPPRCGPVVGIWLASP